MKMSFFIWHIYYYRAFCTVTNDDFADGNLLSHPSAYFGIPTMYLLLFFFFSQLLGLLACFGFVFLLHFCRISFLHVQLSLCLCSLSRQDFATHCEPRWERRLHQLPALDPCLLPLVCICPSCKMYLSVKPNLFVQIWCSQQIKKYPKNILYSDSLAHICSFLGNVLRTLTKEIWNQFKYEFVAYQVFVQH